MPRASRSKAAESSASTSKKAAITIDDGSDDNDSTVGVSTRSGKGRASAASSSDAGDVVIVQSASSSGRRGKASTPRRSTRSTDTKSAPVPPARRASGSSSQAGTSAQPITLDGDDGLALALSLSAAEAATSSVAVPTTATPKSDVPDQPPVTDDPMEAVMPYKSLLLKHQGPCPCGANAYVDKTIRNETVLQKSDTKDAELARKAVAWASGDCVDAFGTATCEKCKSKLCRGCWSEVSECACSVGRAVVVYEILAFLDRTYTKDRLRKPSEANSSPPKKARTSTAKSKPTGAGKGTGYGSGYGASYGAGSISATCTCPACTAKKTAQATNKAAAAANSTINALASADSTGAALASPAAANAVAASAIAAFAVKEEETYDEYDDWDPEDYYDEFGEYPPPKPAKPVNPTAQASSSAAAEKKLNEDTIFASVLRMLNKVLPHPDSETAGMADFMPHGLLVPLIQTSTLPELLADLLRNDSVQDWVVREDLYFALLQMLGSLVEGETTLGIIFARRRAKLYSEGIGAWLHGKGNIAWEHSGGDSAASTSSPLTSAKGKGKKRKADEVAPPAAAPTGPPVLHEPVESLLRKLMTQATAFRRAARNGDAHVETANDTLLISLCGEIEATGERVTHVRGVWMAQQDDAGAAPAGSTSNDATETPKRNTRGKGKGKGKEKEQEQGTVWSDDDYAKACRKLAYEQVQLSVDPTPPNTGPTYPTHSYEKELRDSAKSQRTQGGFMHLAKELAVLSTNLPPGIWLRADEERIDCLKALIAGPEDTPYYGGLFEFDIFIPLNYPASPPKVLLRTTASKRVRFNPNLYADGKCCLSLIGTWPGAPDEQWKPTSTLLQVLISIQSMILGTPYPYYNEPGYGQPCDSKENKAYNSNIHLAATRWAMIDWMDESKKDNAWADVVAMHFAMRKPAITRTLTAWAAKDPTRFKKWTPTFDKLAGTAATSVNQAYYGRVGQVAPPPGGNNERDLVAEFESSFEAMMQRKGGDNFLKELLR